MRHQDQLLQTNDEAVWDWLVWETRGNPSATFRKGDEHLSLGLWRADYLLLCKKGSTLRRAPERRHADCLGRGWIKIYTLKSVDYRQHAGLIRTFLPCLKLTSGGAVTEPTADVQDEAMRAFHAQQFHVVFPYNYDDNSRNSRALGTNVREDRMAVTRGAARLTAQLSRWATASRSNIVAIPDEGVDTASTYAYTDPVHGPPEEAWPFRDPLNPDVNIFGRQAGQHRDTTYTGTEGDGRAGYHFYSVKTGVEFVGTANQVSTSKDMLEENSVHAMSRSELISRMQQKYRPQNLETRYQLEILCVLVCLGDDYRDVPDPADHNPVVALRRLIPEMYTRWDGFQVREIGDSTGEVWFPALAIPTSGMNFAQRWGHSTTFGWRAFWGRAFATKLGRSKAEMLAVYGLQHMTANSQNMLVAFDRARQGIGDVSDSKHVIFRDIGDTILNDHFFAVLRLIDGEFRQVWDHETTSPHGITLASELGQYMRPQITRIGTCIVFFFGPFRQGDANSADILTGWGIACNQGFRAYMEEKIGYRNGWQANPPAALGQQEINALMGRLRQYSGTDDKAKQGPYTGLVNDIVGLHSSRRWALMTLVENEAALVGAGNSLQAMTLAKGLVDAHDLLISADVQAYILTDAGKLALRNFHTQLAR